MESEPSTPVIYTPTTSTAPSVVNAGGGGAAPSVKLPIAARKSLRDNWEAKRSQYEETISKKLGVSWSCPIDYGTIWPYAEDGFAKEDPGLLVTQYIDGFIWHLDYFIEKHSQLGIDELNRVAHTHTLIIAHVNGDEADPATPRNACDIVDGVFRIIFKDGNLDTNISFACERINDAITRADDLATQAYAAASGQPGASVSALNFENRSDIARNWDAKLPALQAEFQDILKAPVFTLSPNLELNAAKLLAWEKAHPRGSTGASSGAELRDDWRGRMGESTFKYFEDAKTRLIDENFGTDDLLQEGFGEAIDKNEIALRVVDSLSKDAISNNSSCELVIENGVAIIQTVPTSWTVNCHHAFENIVSML